MMGGGQKKKSLRIWHQSVNELDQFGVYKRVARSWHHRRDDPAIVARLWEEDAR